jgi:hypothetical protein
MLRPPSDGGRHRHRRQGPADIEDPAAIDLAREPASVYAVCGTIARLVCSTSQLALAWACLLVSFQMQVVLLQHPVEGGQIGIEVLSPFS